MRLSLTALTTAAALTLTLGLVPAGSAAAAADPVVPASAGSMDATSSQRNLALVNKERRTKGRGALTGNTSLAANAYMWSTTMAAIDATGGNGFFHNPSGFDEVRPLGWSRAGENIAWFLGYDAASAGTRFHTQWMNSEGHRRNILTADFTHVGIGIYTSPSGGTYGTQLFAKLSGTSKPVPRLTGFGGTRKAAAGRSTNLKVTAGVKGTLQRYTDSGWVHVKNVAKGASTVKVPAPSKVGRSSIYRIALPATSTTAPTWSPALTVTASRPSRVVSSTWPSKATSVTYGKAVATTVTVRSGAWALERKNPGSRTWTTVKKGTASGTTTLKLRLKPRTTGTTTFRLRAPKTSSSAARTLAVKVTARARSAATVSRTKVTRAAGRSAKITVTATQTARLEKRTGGRWKKVATVKKGTSKVRVTAGRAGSTVKYRVRILRTTKAAGDTSTTISVVARR